MDWPTPLDLSKTVHFIGDIHFGQINTTRTEKLLADLALPSCPQPVARFQIGDLTNESDKTSQDATAKAFLEALEALPGEPPLHFVAGNHDLYFPTEEGTARTRAEWAEAYGTEQRLAIDLGFVKLIGVSPVGEGLHLDEEDISFIDTQLGNTTKPCWVCTHYPLKETLTGPTEGPNAIYATTAFGWFMRGPNNEDDTEVREVLAEHSNAQAYVCGHTHSPISTQGQVRTLELGGKDVAHINCSAIAYVGTAFHIYDPIRTPWLTFVDDNTIEVRWRDHGRGAWVGPTPEDRVQTLTTG